MPSRRSGGVGTTRRKHSLGNLRRAHPASGATWNVQVVRGKMSSKCLWHACRALILGLTLMLLGAGMATIGYYADQLSISPELRGNATVRVKNDLKGFHLNNFSYVGPIVMGFGGFIVVASCVMTFEARDSAAKVVPARLRAGGGSKTMVRSNQSSSASQRRAIGMQLQNSRWDQHFGVFRSSPADAPPAAAAAPFDRDALTAELVKFSKTLSGRHVKTRGQRISNSLVQRTTRENVCALLQPPLQPPSAGSRLYWHAASFDESGRAEQLHLARGLERSRRSDTANRHVLARQRPIEHEEDKNTGGGAGGGGGAASPLGNRRSSTLSDSSYCGRWTVRCASMASRASSIDSRRIQVDLHSPEVMPKSILRSPKRYSSGPSATPSVEKEFRSQLSVCSEPPAAVRQLSGQSSFEPCFPEESADTGDEKSVKLTTELTLLADSTTSIAIERTTTNTTATTSTTSISASPGATHTSILKKPRPDTLPINAASGAVLAELAKASVDASKLQRSNSSRTFYRPKVVVPKERDDSVFYIRSTERDAANELYDSLQVINERRSTLLKADSETALVERKLSSIALMQDIPERLAEGSPNTSLDGDECEEVEKGPRLETTLQLEPDEKDDGDKTGI